MLSLARLKRRVARKWRATHSTFDSILCEWLGSGHGIDDAAVYSSSAAARLPLIWHVADGNATRRNG